MTGPVKKSPAEIAREEEEKGAAVVITAATITPAAKPLKLIEKLALRMGGIEPSKVMTILKQTVFKLPDKYYGGTYHHQEVTEEQMAVLLIVAQTYNLDPLLKEIYAFPDKKGGIVPIVGVDGWSSMINKHKEFDGMKFVDSKADAAIDDHAKRCPEAITCIIYRKDRAHPTEITEYLDEVYRPAFERDGVVKPGPWQSHTKRMLRHKAMIQCARIAFGFTGIHDQDEAERIVASDYVIPNDEPTQAKSLTDRFKTAKDAPVAEDTRVCEVGHVWILRDDVKLGDTVQCRDCPETKIYEPPIEGEAIPPAGAEETAPSHHGTTAPEPKPEPEKKPAAKKKAAAKKPAPKVPDQTAKFMDRIMAATNKDDVTKILTEVADAKGMSAPKRAVLKKTAEVKVKEFDGVE